MKYLNQLNKDLKICNKVQETVNTDGWKSIISPLIDKSIIDVLGGQIDGKWVSGLLDRAKKDERREYYIGYKQALIDLSQRINFFLEQIPLKQDELKHMSEKKNKYIQPMENSPYAPGGERINDAV